jgi:Leucine-rich repeat (LRR) protein/serine/threonine protein phosphatase PrpC
MGNIYGKEGLLSGLFKSRDARDSLDELINSLDPNITRLDLKNRGIERIPENITVLKKLKWLNLPHNKLTHLPDYLCNLTGLLTLRVLGNNIAVLPAQITKMTSLTCLDLGKNDFTEVSASLGELQQLNELHLHWNRIQSLPNEVSKLNKLKILNLYINNMKTFPVLTQLTNLTQLDLGQNKMTELPTSIGVLDSLTTLNLSGNYLVNIPPEVLQPLARLRTLDVRCNLLKTLPKEISALTSLRIMWCRKNLLSKVPPAVYALTNLRELLLAENKIKLIDEGIGEMRELHYLHLYSNTISVLDDKIGECVKLREFDISSNKLTQLPVTMANLSQLLNLSLARNKLVTIPAQLAQGMAALQELNLSDNKIKFLPEELGCLVSLRKLIVNNNRCTQFPDIRAMTSLQWLELGNNRLIEFPLVPDSLVLLNLFSNNIKDVPAWLGDMPQLQRLDVSYNRIKALPAELVKLTALIELHHRGNSLDSIPDVILSLTGLKELSLSNNALAELPHTISQLVNLECLLLSVNRLKTLPASIGDLRALHELDVSHNELHHLPHEFVKLTALTDLDVSGNILENCPPEFGMLSELLQVKVSFNRLRTLPVFRNPMNKQPWISCTGNNEFLTGFYYMKQPSYYMKYLTKWNRETDKLDKMERKKIKKALRQKAKAQKKEGTFTSMSGELSALNSNPNESDDELEDTNLFEQDAGTPFTPVQSPHGVSQPVPIGSPALPASPRSSPDDESKSPRTPPQLTRAESAPVDIKRKGSGESAQGRTSQPSTPPDPSPVSDTLVKSKTPRKKTKSRDPLPVPVNLKPAVQLIEPVETAAPNIEIETQRNWLGWLGWSEMRGRRPDMQDTIVLVPNFLDPHHNIQHSKLQQQHDYGFSFGASSSAVTLGEDTYLLAMFDGHGGTQSAELAATRLPAVLISHLEALIKREEMHERRRHSADEQRPSEWRRPESEDKPRPDRKLKDSKKGKSVNQNIQQTTTPPEGRRGRGHKSGRSLDLGRRSFDVESLSQFTTEPEVTPEVQPLQPRELQPRYRERSRSLSKTDVDESQLMTGDSTATPSSDTKKKSKQTRGTTNAVSNNNHLMALLQERVVDSEGTNRTALSILEEALIATYYELHQDIVKLNFQDGTAALLAIIMGDNIVLANAGDQRAVLSRSGKAIPLTKDHRPDVPEEKERIERDGGFVSENKRVDGVLALSRALGDPELHPHVSQHPDIIHCEITAEDEWLIMCCDGVWDVMDNDTAVSIVNSEKDPNKAAVKLRDYAHGLGSTDNISVICFNLKQRHQAIHPGKPALATSLPKYLSMLHHRGEADPNASNTNLTPSTSAADVTAPVMSPSSSTDQIGTPTPTEAADPSVTPSVTNSSASPPSSPSMQPLKATVPPIPPLSATSTNSNNNNKKKSPKKKNKISPSEKKN